MPGVSYETNVITSPVWAADMLSPNNLVRGPIELDPAQFPMDDGTFVVVGAAGAAAGATSIPVDAIDAAIPSGTFLNFGTLAPVTVTVSDATVNAGDTAIGVTALSGPIPAGTILQFSGSGAGFAKLTADAAAAATSLTVEALPEGIDDAATATFPGGTKQARLTAAAAAGATSLTVDELQFAVADDEQATYGGSGTLKRRVKGGTFVGRTYTERESNVAFGPAASGDEEVFLVAFDAPDLDADPTATAVKPGVTIKENFLPFYGTMSAAVKALLRAAYVTQKGVA